MAVTKEETEILFKKMMKELEGCPETDGIYQVDMKDFKIPKPHILNYCR